MKKKIKIGKIIGVVLTSLVVITLSYLTTYYIDKYNLSKKVVNVTVTFDDTETYIIPNTSNLDKIGAMLEWPYMFTINNEGNTDSLYQIIIKDKDSNIERKYLSYLLIVDDKEIKEGLLSDIEEDILYVGSIMKNTSQRYNIYVWVNQDIDVENAKYEYQLSLNAIMDGGPGF